MRKIRNAVLIAAVLTATTFGAGSLSAHENAQKEGGSANKMHDGAQEMMQGHDMMEEMNSMMKKCSAMMDKMQKDQKAESTSA